jgi:hypothetical protein
VWERWSEVLEFRGAVAIEIAKNQKETDAWINGGFLYVNQTCWITSRETIPYSKKNRWKIWQKTENYTLTNIRDFGNPWITLRDKIN